MDAKERAVKFGEKAHELAEALVTARQKLQQHARPSCRRCYGRGWIGTLHDTPIVVPCSCVKKAIERERVRQSSRVVAPVTESPVAGENGVAIRAKSGVTILLPKDMPEETKSRIEAACNKP